MFYNDNLTGKRIWKYNLVDESIAAAASGMFPITGLDKRCIIFTIHIVDMTGHPSLCRTLFDTVESFFADKKLKLRSATHCGLASFIDVNGSKFTGADRDMRQVHCHGFVLIPWNICEEDVQRLMTKLEWTAHQASHNGRFVVKAMPSAVEFKVFDCSRPDSGLGTWVAYAQKEAVRIDQTGDHVVMLPFDMRSEYGADVAGMIEKKRMSVLSMVRGGDRFKVFRSPKAM